MMLAFQRLLQRVLLDESSQITTAAALVALVNGCEQSQPQFEV